MAPAGTSTGLLFGMGNPLLDISVSLDGATGPNFLQKYGLEANNAILADESHVPMYEEMVQSMDVDYIAGGATQNSIRVAQWLLTIPQSCTYFGCIGDDKFGKTLETKASEDGVKAVYQISDKEATGTCAVICTEGGKNRSLVANLASANLFTKDHVDVDTNWKLVESANVYYIAGFFLTVSPPSIMKVAQHACEKNKIFTMNLSAPFLCQVFKDPMMAALPYVDILFGNETEAATFAKEQNFGTEDIKEIAKKAAALPKVNKERSRMVVFTQGDQPTIICQDGKVVEYSVIPLSKSEMVDTNGAGDAFVGGFLANLVRGKAVPECVELAKRTAKLIIGRSGCTFPAAIPADIKAAL